MGQFMNHQVDPRIIFAAERTLLAWIRTGLSLMGFGFVVARFSLLMHEMGILIDEVRTPGFSLWIGFTLVILGVLVNIFAGYAYSKNMQRLVNNTPIEIKHWPMGRVVSLVLALAGLIMASYLLLI